MRIVAGEYGGRRLQTPKGKDIRPTSDKIRGALFNMLRGYDAVAGAHVLDAFCGTGALGLEAISQGAKSAVFVDKAKTSLDLAKANAVDLGITDQARFILNDSVSYLKQLKSDETFDLIFLDPPYRKEFIHQVLEIFKENDSLNEDGICVLEAEKEFELMDHDPFLRLQDKIYGDTKIILLARK